MTPPFLDADMVSGLLFLGKNEDLFITDVPEWERPEDREI